MQRNFRSLALLALFLALVSLLAGVHPAAAQTGVVGPIVPVPGSNVSGSLSVSANPDGAASIALSLAGLTPGWGVQAVLVTGSCAAPNPGGFEVFRNAADASGRLSATFMVLSPQGTPMRVGEVADGRHALLIYTGGALAACGAIPPISGGEPTDDFATALLAEAERQQVMQFNPSAALQKRIFADGFVPNSAEFGLTLEATNFAVQRAEHLRSGAVRAYFARVGDWGNVRFCQRGAHVDAFCRVVLDEAERRQAIRFNPAAALQKRIFADGFVPNSAEFVMGWDGVSYTAQRAEHLATGRVRAYYAVTGRWSQVSYVERGAAPAGPALAFAPASGPSGTVVRLTGTGFPPNTWVTAWGGPVGSEGIQLGAGITDPAGRITLNVPVTGGAGMRWVFGLVAGALHAEAGEFTITW